MFAPSKMSVLLPPGSSGCLSNLGGRRGKLDHNLLMAIINWKYCSQNTAWGSLPALGRSSKTKLHLPHQKVKTVDLGLFVKFLTNFRLNGTFEAQKVNKTATLQQARWEGGIEGVSPKNQNCGALSVGAVSCFKKCLQEAVGHRSGAYGGVRVVDVM